VRIIWGIGGAVIALSGLGACMVRDPLVVYDAQTVASGAWVIERQADRVTGGPISSATVTSRQVSTSSIVFPPSANMQLACFKQDPTIRFGFQFKVGSTRNAELGYRFDDRPGRQVDARFLPGGRVVVIDDTADVVRFVNELGTAQLLYIRIRVLNGGRTSAEFPVVGAQAAIASALAACPVKSSASAKRTADRRAAGGAKPRAAADEEEPPSDGGSSDWLSRALSDALGE
jgi:hypothetical protein